MDIVPQIPISRELDKPNFFQRIKNKLKEFNKTIKLSAIAIITLVVIATPIIVSQQTNLLSHAGTSLFNNCTPIPAGLTQEQVQQLSQSGKVQWCTQVSANTVSQESSGLNAEVVTIDLNKQLGPIAHNGDGFLLTLPGTESSNTQSLQPKFFRTQEPQIYQNNSYQNIKNAGGIVQDIVYANYFTNYASKGIWPGDNNNWTTWENSVKQTVHNIQSKGYSVEYDIWNEPDTSLYWQRDVPTFYETWRRAYIDIKQLDPSATIVGPSIGTFNLPYLENFLLYAKQNNVMPSIISWHELDGTIKASQIEAHVASIKQWMSQNGITAKIDINEIIGPSDQYNPGVTLHYFATLERSQVNAAAKACWNDTTGISECWNNSLDGLLTPDTKQQRSSWWVYDEYNQLSGSLVSLNPSANVDGIATVNPNKITATILVGRQGSSTDPVVFIIKNANVLSSIIKNGKIGITIQKIPDSESSALTTIPPNQTFDNLVYNNQISLTLSDLNPSDAYEISFTPPSLRGTSPIVAPQVSQFCDANSSHKAQISWSLSGRLNENFYVDIHNSNNFNVGYWKKGIGYGILSTNAPNNFGNWNGSSGPLVLQAGNTYYAQIYFPLTNEASSVTTFKVPVACTILRQ